MGCSPLSGPGEGRRARYFLKVPGVSGFEETSPFVTLAPCPTPALAGKVAQQSEWGVWGPDVWGAVMFRSQ